MSGAEDSIKIPLNVVINEQQDRVLLAEADTYFVDILVSFMTLPLGKILGLFNYQNGVFAPVIGSLNSLYDSLTNLDDAYFCSKERKQMLLNPRSIFSDDCRGLKINLDDSQPTTYFICEGRDCVKWRNVLDHDGHLRLARQIDTGEGKCQCGKSLKKLGSYVAPSTMLPGEVFMKRDTYNFAISDDLQLRCVASGSILESFRSFGITDINGAKDRTLVLGHIEMMYLFEGLLLSQMPLTDIFLKEHQMMMNNNWTTESDMGSLLHHADEQKRANTTTIVLKAMLQKSTGKFLFAQAGDDFVEFLFSLFTIPLGGVAHLLNGNTNLAGLDNLYKSISSLDSSLFINEDVKTQLVEPRLPFRYLSQRQILPIFEKSRLYYLNDSNGKASTGSKFTDHGLFLFLSETEDSKGGSYLKKMGMFMVMDDLSIRPLSARSTLSFFNAQGVSLSDVDEVEVKVGVEEGLRILKASLNSTAVITNALIRPKNKNPRSDSDNYKMSWTFCWPLFVHDED